MNTHYRTIIHIDLDAFYCAVEELFNPSLKGKPFAVGGRPETRGVVSSCSYLARKFGIHSAMPMASAVALYPDLIILPGRRRDYSHKSRQVMDIIRETTELVEQISIDEAFLDVSENQRDSSELAKEIQRSILEKCELPSSLGIASNKLVAKIATDIGKASIQTDTYPNAILSVPHGEEATFLAPLPLETLWGIGPKTASLLYQIGIKNIGELANWPVQDLVKRLGKVGYDLHSRANGIDHRAVITSRDPKSFSQEITFSQDVNKKNELQNQIKKQSNQIARSLKNSHLLCTTVKLKLRWPDFSTISRQFTMTEPTQDPQKIYQVAKQLLSENWNGRIAVRLIGVGVSGLNPPSRQLSLWEKTDFNKIAHLEAAIYELKSKFGDNSIRRGMQHSTTDNNEPHSSNE